MELELSLALAVHRTPIKGFDLNCNALEADDHLSSVDSTKRKFDGTRGHGRIRNEAFNFASSWNDNVSEKFDWVQRKKKTSYTTTERYGATRCKGGRPPMKSWREKSNIHEHRCGRVANDGRAQRRGGGGGGGITNSVLVKVEMEGVAIGRKIDLNLYHSYEMLTITLTNMFSKYHDVDRDWANNYTLLYQDKEGDWLLAGDLPWTIFIKSVQRMKVVRNDTAHSSSCCK